MLVVINRKFGFNCSLFFIICALHDNVFLKKDKICKRHAPDIHPFLIPVFTVRIPVFGQNPGSGTLYLEQREIFKILLNEYFRKFLKPFYTFGDVPLMS